MKKKRLIPVLLLKNGWLVQSRKFSRHQNLGNPMMAVRRLSQWASDELIYLDITRNDKYDMGRDDQGYKNNQSFLEIIEEVSRETFMPITIGGKIETLNDIEKRLKIGADKVAINTAAYTKKDFIMNAAKEFGSQCIVASVDYKKTENNKESVFINRGRDNIDKKPIEWCKNLQEMGAGEILVNSIDKDGSGGGYDLEVLNEISKKINIPVIACGGASEFSHFKDIIKDTNCDAAAAANIFHYQDQSIFLSKKYLHDKCCNVRKPELIDI